ncbi:MAG: hypothetical protein HOP02_00130 [Methylococcaceae bacterium]|nr:hypothetical protein [Methylococcaceae bacterium]
MFLTTLPILFGFTHLISPLELSLFLLALLAAVFLITPTIDNDNIVDPYSSFYLYLHAAWLGRMSLWRVFWPFFILINIIFVYIDYRIANNTYTIASWKTVHGMVFLPIVWWTVAIWRCSAHAAAKYWGNAARVISLYLAIELILRFIISTQFPHLLFNCEMLLLEYGDC